ncbi:MAG: hypothetical protein WBP26_00520 [Candidatus Saccharimonadales bacterium]
MSQSNEILSDAFLSDAFATRLGGWNKELAKFQASETAFWDNVDKQLALEIPGNSDDDDQTRELVIDGIGNATSAAEWRRQGYGNWLELNLGDSIDTRIQDTEVIHAAHAVLLGELLEGVSDVTERYALRRHLPSTTPLGAKDVLANMAKSKTNLVDFRDFTDEHRGELLSRHNIFGTLIMRLPQDGIQLGDVDTTIAPFTAGIVYALSNENPHLIYDSPFVMPTWDLDAELFAYPAVRILNVDLPKTLPSRGANYWSIGPLPEGPLQYAISKDHPYFRENVALHNRNAKHLWALGKIASHFE